MSEHYNMGLMELNTVFIAPSNSFQTGPLQLPTVPSDCRTLQPQLISIKLKVFPKKLQLNVKVLFCTSKPEFDILHYFLLSELR